MDYTSAHLVWIALAVFLQGMNKGGLPVGTVALPLLVLIWPDQAEPARAAVGFLLPLLCVMDVVAALLYRRNILWNRIGPVLPSVLAGVALASALALSGADSLISFSDRALRGMIGVIGIFFVLYRASSVWLLKRVSEHRQPGRARTMLFGAVAGITSTLAHAAGPVMQMYYLPQRMPKMNYAATTAGFFLIMNLMKVPFYVYHGRITSESLALNLKMLPVIPVGVLLGYSLVRRIDPQVYVTLIHVLLAGTSTLLLLQAFQVL